MQKLKNPYFVSPDADFTPHTQLQATPFLYLMLAPGYLWRILLWLTLAYSFWRSGLLPDLLSVFSNPIDLQAQRARDPISHAATAETLILALAGLAALRCYLLYLRRADAPEHVILNIGQLVYGIHKRHRYPFRLAQYYAGTPPSFMPTLLNLLLIPLALRALLSLWDFAWQLVTLMQDDSAEPLLAYMIQLGNLYAMAWLIVCLRQEYRHANWLIQFADEQLKTQSAQARKLASDFYCDVMRARMQYTPENDSVQFIPQHKPLPADQGADAEKSFWVHIIEIPQKANTRSTQPLRHEPVRYYDRIRLMPRPAPDRHGIYACAITENASIYLPEAESIMTLDTTRSAINLIFAECQRQSDFVLVLKSMTEWYKARPTTQTIEKERIEFISQWLGRKRHDFLGWLQRQGKLYMKKSSPAMFLYHHPSQQDKLLPPVPGLSTDSIDHPHIIMDFNTDLRINELFYSDAVRVVLANNSYEIYFADVDLPVKLNMLHTPEQKLARDILKATGEHIRHVKLDDDDDEPDEEMLQASEKA